MTETDAPLKPGSFSVTAHERILWGRPAGEAVLEEADRYAAKRIFITSTRSLAGKTDGPLQRLEPALGSRHVGTFSAIAAHSPPEDVSPPPQPPPPPPAPR